MDISEKIIITILIVCLLLMIFLLFKINFYDYYGLNPYNRERINEKLYCFWTGNNEMTENRKRNIETLQWSGLDVQLVTPDNLNDYLLNDAPLHEGYQYLSDTHKSDYLRCYFMNFYGGGYSDIKNTRYSWVDSYKLMKQSNKWINGYPEKKEIDVARGDDEKMNKILLKNYSKLVGNGSYIIEKNTDFTNEWYSEMLKMMDSKYEELKKFPARKPRENHPSEKDDYKYPLKWAEFNSIFHKLVYKYNDKVLQTLPQIDMRSYL